MWGTAAYQEMLLVQQRGPTRAQVAEAAGISKPYLSQLESGRRQGTIQVLQKVAAALHVSVDDLVMSQADER